MEEKDKLSEYFKKQLEDYSPDPNWNVPSDQLFDAAISDIPSAPTYKRYLPLLLLLFIPIGLFIFGIATFHSHENQKVELANLQQKIAQLDEDNKRLNTALTNSNASFEKITLENERLKKEISEQKTAINPNLSSNIKADKPIPGSYRAVESFDNSKTSAQISETLTVIEDDLSNSNIEVEERGLLTTENIQSLTIKPQFTNAKYLLNEEIAIEEKQGRSTPQWRYNIAMVNNLSWLSMTDVPAQSESALTEYDKAHGCYGLKVGTEYLFNPRWSVYADLSFNRYQNRSSLQTDLFYDKTKENGEMVELELDIMNPFGSYYSPASFRVDSEINQNDLMQERANIRQHLSTLSLNVGLNYRVMETKKVNIAFGGGLGIVNKLSLKNEFDISLLHNDELKVNYLDETKELKGVNNHFVTGEVKASLEYKISNQSGLFIESTYLQSLTSLRDSWPASGPKTYLHSFNLATGLKFNF